MPSGWSVPRDWPGETVAILASGPSLTREQCDYVRGKCRVIAVNNQGIDTVDSNTRQIVPAFAPWADVLYAADTRWWNHYRAQALAFPGLKVKIRDAHHLPEVHVLQVSHERVFDPRPTHLATGGNSGYQAMHLAAHFGATRLILLGFDMKFSDHRRRHWFGNHSATLNTIGNFTAWIRNFTALAPVLERRGVEVINCTTDTALKCFSRRSLSEAL